MDRRQTERGNGRDSPTRKPARCTQTEGEPSSKCECTQIRTQEIGNSCPTASLADLCDQFVASVNVTDNESFSRVLSSLVTSWQKDEMAARAGIEPMIRFLEACAAALRSETGKTVDAQLRAQELSSLTKIILTWPKLSGEFRAAVLALTQSANK